MNSQVGSAVATETQLENALAALRGIATSFVQWSQDNRTRTGYPNRILKEGIFQAFDGHGLGSVLDKAYADAD